VKKVPVLTYMKKVKKVPVLTYWLAQAKAISWRLHAEPISQ
jgi:hypothetical protein